MCSTSWISAFGSSGLVLLFNLLSLSAHSQEPGIVIEMTAPDVLTIRTNVNTFVDLRGRGTICLVISEFDEGNRTDRFHQSEEEAVYFRERSSGNNNLVVFTADLSADCDFSTYE